MALASADEADQVSVSKLAAATAAANATLAADIAAAQVKHYEEIAALRSSDATLAATDVQTSQTISDLEARTQAATMRCSSRNRRQRCRSPVDERDSNAGGL